MKIYLIRHGESTSDVEERYGGAYDDHLTKKGRKQAKELGKKLLNENIEIIFVSPKFRTRETLQIANEEIEAKTEIIENIQERNSKGVLSGMKVKEAKEKHPELIKLLDDYRNTIEGGESYDNFKERVLSAFDEIIKSSYAKVAILTHGGPIFCIFRELFKKEIKNVTDCNVIELLVSNKIEVIDLGDAYFE